MEPLDSVKLLLPSPRAEMSRWPQEGCLLWCLVPRRLPAVKRLADRWSESCRQEPRQTCVALVARQPVSWSRGAVAIVDSDTGTRGGEERRELAGFGGRVSGVGGRVVSSVKWPAGGARRLGGLLGAVVVALLGIHLVERRGRVSSREMSSDRSRSAETR